MGRFSRRSDVARPTVSIAIYVVPANPVAFPVDTIEATADVYTDEVSTKLDACLAAATKVFRRTITDVKRDGVTLIVATTALDRGHSQRTVKKFRKALVRHVG